MSQPQSIAEAFEPLLPDVAPEEIPMIVALVERLAADRYRGWRDETDDPVERAGLLACAAREDEIAAFIESREADAAAKIDELNARFPDLRERYDSIMAGRTRTEQLRIQAEGELGGADYMRQFSEATEGAVSAHFASLASLEEANSRFLSVLIGLGELEPRPKS
ncbi:MAG: hypothetical protein O7F71_09735 [Gammaproteobacteria bacterium]|nr:hypothetical protein [Gammaproteobacteria bacterium]